jgi:hypothetical protein
MLLQLQGLLAKALAGAVKLNVAATLGTISGYMGAGIGYMGAGIYEELMFRLLLLPLAAWALRRTGLGTAVSMAAAVLLTSLLFSLAHNLGPYGERFAWFNFFFRALAGVFFSLLFVYRGFGIAAGTHALFDILLGLVRF